MSEDPDGSFEPSEVIACITKSPRSREPTSNDFSRCATMPKRRVSAASSVHSWERPNHSWEIPQPADDDLEWRNDCSDSEFEAEDLTPGAEFVENLFSLLMTGCLSCQQFCTAMYFAHRAGVAEAASYAHPPGRPSGPKHIESHCESDLSHLSLRIPVCRVCLADFSGV
jgi:hypothetical protein